MDGYAARLGLVAVLVLLNALFAGSEMALVSLRDTQVRQLEHRGARGRVLAGLARDPNRYLATIQVGITLAGFLASATAAVALAEPLVPLLRFLGGAAEPVAVVVVTAVLTFVTLVVGELAPKRIAMQRAESWALLVAPGLSLLSTLSRPLVWLLAKTTDLLVRMVGVDPRATREEATTEEIRDLIASRVGMRAEQRTIISGAFEIADRTLREILVPRREVLALAADIPTAEAVTVLTATGHTRAPVVRGGELDDTIGVVHLRDLVKDSAGTVADHAYPPLVLPESLPVIDALRQMRSARRHLALVVDEYGTTDGIVALEDLLEEIVGEIYDETDRDLQAVIRQPDGSLLLPGGFPLHDLADLGINLNRGTERAYTTIAGLVLDRLGHIPTAPGETVDLDGWAARVTGVKKRSITAVLLRRSSCSWVERRSYWRSANSAPHRIGRLRTRPPASATSFGPRRRPPPRAASSHRPGGRAPPRWRTRAECPSRALRPSRRPRPLAVVSGRRVRAGLNDAVTGVRRGPDLRRMRRATSRRPGRGDHRRVGPGSLLDRCAGRPHVRTTGWHAGLARTTAQSGWPAVHGARPTPRSRTGR